MDIKSSILPTQFNKWFNNLESFKLDVYTFLINKKIKSENSLYDSLLILLYDDYITFSDQKKKLIRNLFFKKLSIDFDQKQKYVEFDYKYHKIKIAPIRRALNGQSNMNHIGKANTNTNTNKFCVLQYIADYFSINIILFYVIEQDTQEDTNEESKEYLDEIQYFYPTKYVEKNNTSCIALFYKNKYFYPMMIHNKNIFKISDLKHELDNIIDYCISNINLEKIEKNKKTRNKKKDLIKVLARSKMMELREYAIKYNIEITRYDEKYEKVRYKSKTDLLEDLKKEIIK